MSQQNKNITQITRKLFEAKKKKKKEKKNIILLSTKGSQKEIIGNTHLF